jgi:hypothetical protein
VASAPSFEDFDPNKPGHGAIWGVFTTRFKTYAARGPALNAVLHHSDAKLYEYVPEQGEWVLRALRCFASKPTSCEVCMVTTVVQTHDYRGQQIDRNKGRYKWDREAGKITSPPRLLFTCEQCWREG